MEITKYNLIDSGKYVNDTFLNGLKFWQTKYPNIYITDYDPNVNVNLKSQNMLRLISTGNVRHQEYFNIEQLNDVEAMNAIIENFHKEIIEVK